MKYGKKFLGILLALVMCLSVLCPASVQAADICFTAIDESVLKLTNESMPVWSGGVLYAPYTTFNELDNGISKWGIQPGVAATFAITAPVLSNSFAYLQASSSLSNSSKAPLVPLPASRPTTTIGASAPPTSLQLVIAPL